MLFYVEAAKQYMPPLPIPANYDEKKLRKFNDLTDRAAFFARALAPYQSPTYRSITVQAPRDTAMRGTPAIDALESFVLTLAAVRRTKPVETVDLKVNESEPEMPTLIAVKRNGP